jgi:hypothetical protein
MKTEIRLTPYCGKNPPILKPNVGHLNNACYELALGAEAFITSTGDTKRTYKVGEQVRIPPGQFALLITEEELCIPRNVLAFNASEPLMT